MNIIVSPEHVWERFLESKSTSEIASNPAIGVNIYVSSDNDLPRIIVTSDDTEIHSELIRSEEECEDTVRDIYDSYLTNAIYNLLSSLFDEEDDEPSDEPDDEFDLYASIIEDSEETLDDAVRDFVIATSVTPVGVITDEIIQDLKEHFLEYMARKHDLSIHRPMILEDEDGSDVFEEYPYECMEFEDDDNPIYK